MNSASRTNISSRQVKISRLGFHYFPDTVHYSEHDLQSWLPELQKLAASWITLLAPTERAIPEYFINALIDAEIEPILHFVMPINGRANDVSLRLLLRSYARWGVRYVVLGDRPNNRSSWTTNSWAQIKLVERFLDIFLPQANLALNEGLLPVFPPLEPGGDFWDTAFLRTALRSIKRRDFETLLERLVLGVYAFAVNRPVNWGSGGPARWPGARPYDTPPGVQDQLGFRIFDWYETISKEEIGSSLPILLLRAGSRPGDHQDLTLPQVDEVAHADKNLEIARLIANDSNVEASKDPIPDEVLACNFWLLSAAKTSEFVSHAWFQPDGEKLLVIDRLHKWLANFRDRAEARGSKEIKSVEKLRTKLERSVDVGGEVSSLIAHYLLLPLYSWGAAEWDLELIQPLIQEFHPTVGFSLSEACLASHVTVVGSEEVISEEALQMLREAGCTVDRLSTSGTLCAS
ncbi:MAG: hypothetical protein WBD56_10115 [Anaerolineales bacterium]